MARNLKNKSAVRVGIDVVRISRIADSIGRFGDRFIRRLFTDNEITYAQSAPDLTAERLAARFAAKEAAFKALALVDRGIGLKCVEVRRGPDGACDLVLHGPAAVAAAEAGVSDMSVSLSHEDDYATAVVVAQAGTRGAIDGR